MKSACAMVLVLLSGLVGPAAAQVAPATALAGTVADESDAVVPGVPVELTNVKTRFTRRTETDSQGRFLFDLVPPGTYDLTVSARGFAIYRQQGITLDVNVPANVRVTISIGGTAEEITVQANAPMVDNQSGTLRQVVSEHYIRDLPLNGRNAAFLVYMAPEPSPGKEPISRRTPTPATPSRCR